MFLEDMLFERAEVKEPFSTLSIGAYMLFSTTFSCMSFSMLL
jgi:hypothetical protein